MHTTFSVQSKFTFVYAVNRRYSLVK